MKINKPENVNYAAQVVRVPAVIDLPGLDNLVGVPVLGHQALTQRDGVAVGELKIAFTAETQLSDAYAHENDLYRHENLNKTGETGYLEDNRRVKAIRLRKHVSNALLMPLESVAFTGVDLADLTEGVTFDKLGDHEICRKYVVRAQKVGTSTAKKIESAFKRVDKKVFPEHLDTDNYFRSAHLLYSGREVVTTQKLHGTSFRAGRVPVLRQKTWRERFARWFGVRVDDYEYDAVFGSRKVIKDANNPNQNHHYGFDLWTDYGRHIEELIPAGYIVYGELIGWTPDGAPLQKNYTYHVPKGEAELYVYRVAHVNAAGVLSDLSWDGVKVFCRDRGLKWVPELARITVYDAEAFTKQFLDERLADHGDWNEPPLIVSDHKTVDEGVCFRQEGLVPTILKAKSPKFLEHETKLLDKGEEDMEAAA